jgi:hypothetical protein
VTASTIAAPSRVRTPSRAATVGAAGLVVLLALPLVVENIYYQHVLIICLVYVVLGHAWNLVGG